MQNVSWPSKGHLESVNNSGPETPIGAALGTKAFEEEPVQSRVASWVAEIQSLSEIAKFQPQAAYAALPMASQVDGLSSCARSLLLKNCYNPSKIQSAIAWHNGKVILQ